MPFFVIQLGWVFAYGDYPFSIKSGQGAIWTETPNRIGGWSLYQAKSYRTCDQATWRDLLLLAISLWQRRAGF